MTDTRRTICLVVAVSLLVAAASLHWSAAAGPARFAAGSLMRIGGMLGAIWLAWNSLRRPADWLPPGLLVVALVILAAIAAQPRLGLVLLPLAGVLTAAGAVMRWFRSRRR